VGCMPLLLPRFPEFDSLQLMTGTFFSFLLVSVKPLLLLLLRGGTISQGAHDFSDFNFSLYLRSGS